MKSNNLMSRKINLIGVCAISGLCILLLFASHKFTSTNYTTEYLKPHNNLRLLNSHKYYGSNFKQYSSSSSFDTYPPIPTAQNSSITVEDILNYQRERINEEMQDFEYPNGLYDNDAKKLSDLTPETGGNPVRSLIITTWRSGSTFLGDILNSMPGNYYHYEPLLNFDIIQIRGAPYAKQAIRNLKHLLHCNYTDMEGYLEFGRSHNYLFSHNTRLWRQCRLFPQFCYEPKFLEAYCKLFPIQSMKVVRLRMSLAAQLLADESLNVRIILLIRDPRGSLQSRKHRVWCPGRPDCDHPPTVCKDMVLDFESARELTKLYPEKFKAVRYEDLSLKPYTMAKDILKFYGLPFDPQVEAFLDTHTKLDIGGVSSTFRDSKSAPFHWTKDLTFDEVKIIQDSCVDAMKSWGYKNATSERELYNNFNPLLSYNLS